jgi:hypothetical protein
MSLSRSYERRRLAAQCVVLAQQASDPKDRIFLLEIAQKWFRLAELEWETDRLRAVQAEIGEALRAQYDLPAELPDQLVTLLMRLDEGHAG